MEDELSARILDRHTDGIGIDERRFIAKRIDDLAEIVVHTRRRGIDVAGLTAGDQHTVIRAAGRREVPCVAQNALVLRLGAHLQRQRGAARDGGALRLAEDDGRGCVRGAARDLEIDDRSLFDLLLGVYALEGDRPLGEVAFDCRGAAGAESGFLDELFCLLDRKADQRGNARRLCGGALADIDHDRLPVGQRRVLCRLGANHIAVGHVIARLIHGLDGHADRHRVERGLRAGERHVDKIRHPVFLTAGGDRQLDRRADLCRSSGVRRLVKDRAAFLIACTPLPDLDLEVRIFALVQRVVVLPNQIRNGVLLRFGEQVGDKITVEEIEDAEDRQRNAHDARDDRDAASLLRLSPAAPCGGRLGLCSVGTRLRVCPALRCRGFRMLPMSSVSRGCVKSKVQFGSRRKRSRSSSISEALA